MDWWNGTPLSFFPCHDSFSSMPASKCIEAVNGGSPVGTYNVEGVKFAPFNTREYSLDAAETEVGAF